MASYPDVLEFATSNSHYRFADYIAGYFAGLTGGVYSGLDGS
jgi:hypothetical protein